MASAAYLDAARARQEARTQRIVVRDTGRRGAGGFGHGITLNAIEQLRNHWVSHRTTINEFLKHTQTSAWQEAVKQISQPGMANSVTEMTKQLSQQQDLIRNLDDFANPYGHLK